MFLFVPYKTDLQFARWPIITYSIVALCILIHFMQSSNRHQIISNAKTYCQSIYDSEFDETSLDYLTTDRGYCVYSLNSLHQFTNSIKRANIATQIAKEIPYYSEQNIPDLVQAMLDHYEAFRESAVSSLDAKLLYDPSSWNPIKMLLSTVSHGSWWHLLGNLVFFLAFAPALEILCRNRLLYLMVFLAIGIFSNIAYSITSLFDPIPVPSYGLSGVVMGMIGFAAFMMPSAKIRCFVWFFTIIKNISVSAWILAAWYIGWDAYDLFTRTDNGGINLVAHVGGGLAGYLIGHFFFRTLREENRDELEDEIEYRRSQRSDRGMLSSYKGNSKKALQQHREELAQKEHNRYVMTLYHLVNEGRDSDAICLLLEDAERKMRSLEIFENLYRESVNWPKSRLFFCLSRLLIGQYIELRKPELAIPVAKQCLTLDKNFVLSNPADVIAFVRACIQVHEYKLAYALITRAEQRYGNSIDVVRAKIIEIDLVLSHFKDHAKAQALASNLLHSQPADKQKEIQALIANLGILS